VNYDIDRTCQQFFKLLHDPVVEDNTIIPYQILRAKEAASNAWRNSLVFGVLPMRANHAVQPRTLVRNAIIAQAEHVNGSVPQPPSFAAWNVNAKLLLQHACVDSEVLIMLRKVSEGDLALVLLYARNFDQPCVESEGYSHYIEADLSSPLSFRALAVFLLPELCPMVLDPLTNQRYYQPAEQRSYYRADGIQDDLV